MLSEITPAKHVFELGVLMNVIIILMNVVQTYKG